MPQITRESLMSLEAYAKARPEFRAKVMAHKKNRIVHLGENVTLVYEDELTIRYQIQEMLRNEKTFEEAGILDELEAYTPPVPEGSNWKATMMIEYPEETERRTMLAELKAWLAGTGAWSATCRPIVTCTSPPWLAPPEGAPGGTGGGTGAKARCSPLLAATAEVRGGQMCAESIALRGDISACRCCELERVSADGSGRRPVPPADAHESWWDGVPGRERPPCHTPDRAFGAPRGSLTPRPSVSVLVCHATARAPCRALVRAAAIRVVRTASRRGACLFGASSSRRHGRALVCPSVVRTRGHAFALIRIDTPRSSPGCSAFGMTFRQCMQRTQFLLSTARLSSSLSDRRWWGSA